MSAPRPLATGIVLALALGLIAAVPAPARAQEEPAPDAAADAGGETADAAADGAAGEGEAAEPAPPPGPPSVVTLTNGDRLSGEIKTMTKGKLVLATSYAGDVTLDWTQVASVESSQTLPWVLADGTEIVSAAKTDEQGHVALGSADMEDGTRVAIAKVSAIAPPAPVDPPDIKIKGAASLGGVIEDGNTNSKSANAKANLQTRTKLTRLSLSGNWNYVETEGLLTSRSLGGEIKFDYFPWEKDFFLFVQASLLRDDFQDLELRTVLSGGVGWQIIEEDWLEAFVEGGLAYVDENFDDGVDETSLSVRVAWGLDWVIVKDRLTFRHRGEILPSLEDADDFIANLDQELRLTIFEGFFASAGVLFRYDNSPAAGQGRRDTRYTINIGYQFATEK